MTIEDFTLRLPFLKLLVGRRGSGKTTLLIKLLLRNDIYRNKFDKIYVFSTSFWTDTSSRIHEWLLIQENQVTPGFREDKLQFIINDQKEKKLQDPENDHHVLIILDDILAEVDFKKSLALQDLAFNGRHRNISVIILSQRIVGINTKVRNQADGIVYFPFSNHSETEAMYNSYSFGNRREFNKFLDSAKNSNEDRGNFIYFNVQKDMWLDKHLDKIDTDKFKLV